MHWYKYEEKLDEREVQTLIDDLLGETCIKIPSFVQKFDESASDSVIVEVRRVAELKRDVLLHRVDAMWRYPPPIAFQAGEVPTLFQEPIPSSTLAVMYASFHWVLDAAGQSFEARVIKAMIRDRLDVKGAQLPVAKHLPDPQHSITIKTAIYAKRRKDYWIQECIDWFARYGVSGARNRDLTS